MRAIVLQRAARVVGVSCLLVAALPVRGVGQTRPDSLTLQQPSNVYVIPQMNVNRQWFVNYIFWEDVPDSMGTFIHQPGTSGWRPDSSLTPPESLSVPGTSGIYTGSVDRSVKFRLRNSGRVGVTPLIRLRYEIAKEEVWGREINIGAGYVPGDPIDCTFIHQVNGSVLDLGLRLHLTPGLVDSNGVFIVGMEDFEGFHAWGGIRPDGSDLTVLGEVSKQEAFTGTELDTLYFTDIIPALRATGVYVFPFPVPGLGSRIDLTGIHPNGRLGPNEFVWFDTNAFSGFTYYYAVTTFDSDYNVDAQSQGLFKFDNCMVTEGQPYPCASELVRLSATVTPQDDLMRVYTVPNPFRSGSSQYTTPNYHNFPDNKLRFVNVPAECKIRVYTVAGDFVVEINNTSGTGTVEWDTKNTAGEFVTSGAYMYRCETGNGDSVYGRIVIIR